MVFTEGNNNIIFIYKRKILINVKYNFYNLFICVRRYIRNPDKDSKELIIYDKSEPIYPLSSFTPVPVSKGSLVIIHGQIVHRSESNKSKKSRHAYTFHVIETDDNVKYSNENWLQPTKDKPFPLLYCK